MKRFAFFAVFAFAFFCFSGVANSVVLDLDAGCSQGYWKTHSKYGPASHDITWDSIGEDTKFFLSEKTYYESIWTSPKDGNAYYQLAHQYIAATLNQKNKPNK